MAAISRFATVSEDDFRVQMFFFLFFEIITCVFILKQLLNSQPRIMHFACSDWFTQCRLSEGYQGKVFAGKRHFSLNKAKHEKGKFYPADSCFLQFIDAN